MLVARVRVLWERVQGGTRGNRVGAQNEHGTSLHRALPRDRRVPYWNKPNGGSFYLLGDAFNRRAPPLRSPDNQSKRRAKAVCNEGKEGTSAGVPCAVAADAASSY
jgi:hypothetical protein